MSNSNTAVLNSHEAVDSSLTEELVHISSNEKELERQRLQDEVEAFLSRGGLIRHIPVDQRADPPKKPESNYGGQPI